MSLSTKALSLHEFCGFETRWNDLLSRSSANQLFLSWGWMFSWWKVYAESNFDLLVLCVYEQEELLCIAPLYKYTNKTCLDLSFSSVEFIGSHSYKSRGFFLEYCEFIYDKAGSAEVKSETIAAIFNWLSSNVSFDQFRLNNLVVGSDTYEAFGQWARTENLYCRTTNLLTTYGVDLRTGFGEFLSDLGKNTRLKLYNRRKYFGPDGLRHVEVGAEELPELITYLNAFHRERWGKNIIDDDKELFLDVLAKNSDVTLTGIFVLYKDKVIGCTFNIEVGNKCFNIQMGYEENFHKKISVGLLALGYDIERCSRRGDLEYYDLMAGEGKKGNYKERLSSEGSKLESIQGLGSWRMKLIYSIRDFLKTKLGLNKGRLYFI